MHVQWPYLYMYSMYVCVYVWIRVSVCLPVTCAADCATLCVTDYSRDGFPSVMSVTCRIIYLITPTHTWTSLWWCYCECWRSLAVRYLHCAFLMTWTANFFHYKEQYTNHHTWSILHSWSVNSKVHYKEQYANHHSWSILHSWNVISKVYYKELYANHHTLPLQCEDITFVVSICVSTSQVRVVMMNP